MNIRLASSVVALAFCFTAVAAAELIVNPPLPITHRVQVQIIATALDNGSSPATLLGNATQRAAIEAGIDAIWAQAGIDIEFLPIKRYNSTFAYEGYSGALPRPTSDLSAMTNLANVSGILHPDYSVINAFFVDIVPGFAHTSDNTANGIANLGSNGLAQYVGDNLLTFQNGRDVVAQVLAHEIGHNLGLKHTAHGAANLMSNSNASEQLSSEQIAAIFQTTALNNSWAVIPHGGTGFPQLLPPGMPGDYNSDGVVNAADYTIWRKTMGSITLLAADGNGNGRIDSGDYEIWKTNFGGGGSASAAGLFGPAATGNIPEPGTGLLLLIGLGQLSTCRRCRRRR